MVFRFCQALQRVTIKGRFSYLLLHQVLVRE